MNFCATCGRQRNGDARFCAGCGNEFPAATTASGTLLADQSAGGTPPAGQPSAEYAPADATRVERQPDVTRIDTRGAAPSPAAPSGPAEPDPFASWFAADPPAGSTPPAGDSRGGWQQAEPWQAADTVYAAPSQRAPAYPPPPPYGGQQPPPYGGQQQPPYGGQQPPAGRQQRSSGGRKAPFIIVIALVMLAAGGGAYALVSRSDRHNSASNTPTGTASSASASAHASASASASAPASASSSPSASASASASASPGVVSLAPGAAANPAAPAVEKTLTAYFQGINNHNYAEYASSLDPQEQAAQPQSQFESGYKSTADSGMKLISLASGADGGLQATVTFTSHQTAGTGVDGSPCNAWRLIFYLVKQGAGYVKGAAPAGCQPSYTDC